jgi:hypothetical protein
MAFIACGLLFLLTTYGIYRYAFNMNEWEEVFLDLG